MIPRPPRGAARTRPLITAILLAAVTVLAVLPILIAGPAAGAPAAAATTIPRATAGAALTVELDDASAASISPGSTYVLTGSIRNTGTTRLRSITVRLRVDWPRLTGAEIAAWADRAATDRLGAVWATQTLPGELAAGESNSFEITGRADELGLPIADGFGPRGLAVEVLADPGDGARRLAVQRSFVVWDPGEGTVATRISVLAPITPLAGQASTDAGAPTPELTRQWLPGGRLARIIAATADTPAAWILDPSLLTAALSAQGLSVTPSGQGPATDPTAPASGAATPTPVPGSGTSPSTGGASPTGTPGAGAVDPAQSAAARAWLEAIVGRSADRDVYALPWGDPDLSALAHADAGAVLRAGVEEAASVTRAVWGRPVDGSLFWPVDGTADAGVVALIARAPATGPAGTPTRADLVLSSASLPASTTPDAVASGRIEVPGSDAGTTALISDPRLGPALAAVAGSGSGSNSGSGSFLAFQRVLALIAAHSAGATAQDPPGVVADLPRDWDPVHPEAFSRAVAELDRVPWIHVEHLSQARQARAEPAPATLIGARERYELPRAHVRQVAQAFGELEAFRPALLAPEVSYQPARRAALSLVARGWRSPLLNRDQRDRALTVARARLIAQPARYRQGLSVITGSTANLVSTSGQLPVTVTSTLAEPVSLLLVLEPESRRLRVGDPVPISISAATGGTARASALVDVTAVANGDVDVTAELFAPGGTQPLVVIDEPIRVRVRHDWETRTLTGAAIVLGLLLLVGLRRSVRAGRRARIPLDQVPDPDDVALVAAGERLPTPPLGLHRLAPVGPGVPGGPGDPASPGGRSGGTGGPDDSGGAGGAGGPGGSGAAGASGMAGPHPSPQAGGEPTTPEQTATHSLMRSSAVMSAGTLVSRVLGWVRASVLSAAIGGAASGSVFATANTLPNSVFILIGGGALNAILVPQIVRAAKQSDDGGTEYIDRLLTLATLILGGATIVATAAAPLLIRLYSDGWDQPTLDLGTAMAVWCLPQIFFYGLYTLYGQVLNARGSFGPYMWAPVVNNIVAIAGLVVFIALAGSGERPVTGWSAGDVALLAGTATLGVVANALVLVPVMRRSGYVWRPRWGWRGIGLRNAGSIALWTLAGVALAQLGFLVISRVVNAAGSAAQRDGIPAGRAVFDFGFMIFMMPHSLIAVSLVTAVFTRLSARAAEGDLAAVRDDLSLAWRTVSVATTFATAVFLALGPLITAAMFPGTSRVTTDQYALVATAMLIGIVPYSAQFLFQRVSFAFEDARTPFWIGALGTGLWTAAALWVPTWLEPRLVPAGVGLAMAMSNLVTASIWVPVLRRRLGSLDGLRVLSTHLKVLLAAGVATGMGILVREGTQVIVGRDGALGVHGVLVAAGAVMSITYLLALRVLRVRELDSLLQPLLARWGR